MTNDKMGSFSDAGRMRAQVEHSRSEAHRLGYARGLPTRKKLAWLVVVFAMVYVGGYCFARSRGWLIHRSGFAGGNTDHHSIDVGDLGRGGSPAYGAAYASHLVFTPLRWGETAYWYVRHPVGKPWPY